MSRPLCRKLGLAVPLVQAPMAGGATTPALVAAVSGAGALGSLAAAALTPAGMVSEVAAIRALTDRPFAINLFVQDTPQPDTASLDAALARLAPWHAGLGLPAPGLPDKWCEPFAEQLETLIALQPAAASFTFGILTVGQVARLRAAGIMVVGTATSLAEGLAWQAAGADAVCAQGEEAGGHRGTFLGEQSDSLTPMLALTRQLAGALEIPVIAAGGMMDGHDMAAALAAGAQACQLGTAFLRCPESGISAPWKQALAEAPAGSTRLTRAFSGRLARGVVNGYMQAMADFEAAAPAYPLMNALTGPLRAAAARQSRAECLSLWAGTGVHRAQALPAAQLVASLAAGCAC